MVEAGWKATSRWWCRDTATSCRRSPSVERGSRGEGPGGTSLVEQCSRGEEPRHNPSSGLRGKISDDRQTRDGPLVTARGRVGLGSPSMRG